jgi:hypothetical protein
MPAHHGGHVGERRRLERFKNGSQGAWEPEVGHELPAALEAGVIFAPQTARQVLEVAVPGATAADVDEAVQLATTIHQRAQVVLDHMYPY